MAVCSNGHLAVDTKYQLIVDHEVTHAVTALEQFAPLAPRAQETLATAPLEAVAELGSSNGEAIKKCLDEGLVPHLPQPKTAANRHLGLGGKEDFLSDATQDGYRCPGEPAVTLRFAPTAHGRPMRYDATAACTAGPRKPPCTRNTENRSIPRGVHETLLEEMQQRGAAHPEQVKARTGMVAPPFGTMKRGLAQGDFRTRGLVTVRGELRLTLLVSNWKRVRNILGVAAWIAAGVSSSRPQRW